MKRTITAAMIGASALTSAFAGNYKVTVPLTADEEGAMAYIVNYDTGAKVDSVLVEDGAAVFNGTIADPIPARLIIDGNRAGQFILEDAEITVDPAKRTITGGALNDKNNAISAQIQAIGTRFQTAATEAEKEAIYAEYETFRDKALNENLDNPIGYTLFMDKAYDFTPAQLDAFLAANPYFTKFTRVNKLVESNRRKAATSEGSKFTDFEIEYDGVKHRLSDVVGKGDYVLVDFWASWCGPCIRQTAVLKDIYNEYKEDGLKVLGVAVWDEPENTKKAIVQHELPWESWLNGGNIPTDAYGISGIPCIILFGPDGTILSRDKQSDELKAAVAAAMNEAKAAKSK